jgi:hypothetical protein
MTLDEIKQVIVDALMRIAPEIEPGSIESGTSFRDQLDLDSMDFLNFVLALHDRCLELLAAGVPIARIEAVDLSPATRARDATPPEGAEEVASVGRALLAALAELAP